MGSLVLMTFSFAVIGFQLSCKKEATAQTVPNYSLPPATTSVLGGVIIGSGLSITSSGILSTTSTGTGLSQLNKLLIHDGTNFATINYDGTNKTIISFTLPTGRTLRSTPPKGHLSPDGNILFFEVYESSTGTYFIYSCSINGSNLKVVFSSTKDATLFNAY